MDKFDSITEQFNIYFQQQQELEVEYRDKIKGDLYNQKVWQLADKMNSLKKKALSLGAGMQIIKFKGIIVRPHRKNHNIKVDSPFTLYLTDLTPQEAIKVLELRFKNVKSYKMEVIFSGKLYD